MRIRPFFWCLLALSSLGVLIFAATLREQAPAVMQLHLAQQVPASVSFTSVELHLTDTQGLPIEKAQVSPSATMTNMAMETKQITVKELGQGNYLVQLHLYMAGPWQINIATFAEGFDSLKQTLLVQVQ